MLALYGRVWACENYNLDTTEVVTCYISDGKSRHGCQCFVSDALKIMGENNYCNEYARFPENVSAPTYNMDATNRAVLF